MNLPRETLLISRVIDGDATTAEWDELSAIAEHDTEVWARLADTLRDHRSLAGAMNRSVAVADAIELPAAPPAALRPGGRTLVEVPPRRALAGRLGLWSGWAVAAAVALAWTVGWFRPALHEPTPEPRAGAFPGTTAEALQRYVDLGRRDGSVVGLPDRVLVDSRPSSTGEGVELLFMQPILQRETVPDAWRLDSRDDAGGAALIRYEHPRDRNPPM